jgi:VWFA-related protein
MRAWLAAVIVIASASLQAQQPPTVFRSTTDLVEVDVVVHDRKGAFVRDLTADDFTIEEAGRPREIVQFYLTGADAPAAAAAPGGPVVDPAAARSASRVFVVVFDDAHLTPSGFKRTQAAALTLFSQQFRPGDIGGVVTRGRMAKDRLTSNRDELLKAVKDAKPDSAKSSRAFDERMFPRLSEIEAVRIAVGGDKEVLAEAVRRACADDPSECRFDPESLIRNKATQMADVARAESARTLQILRVLVAGLTRFEGRKTILLMSEGFIAEETWPLVQEVVGTAARANARLYTLDARGLERGLRSIDDGAPGTDDANARMLEQMDVGADSINSLAVDTGGFVVRNTNQFDKAVARIADDVNHYYVLAYRPAAPPDGKFQVRGNIEDWARRDNEFTGADPARLFEQNYFDVYLRYWEQYHVNLALTGLKRDWKVVVYSQERMMSLAKEYFRRFRSRGEPEQFKVFDKRDMHREWRPSAERAICRVSETWKMVGLTFPVDELMEGW